MKKRNKAYKPKPTNFNISRMLDMARDFAEIEKFFRQCKSEVLVEVKDTDSGKWLLSQKNLNGESYDLLASIDGWLKFFSILADKAGMREAGLYDDSAINKLVSKLRLGQTVTHELVDDAEKILKPQRYLFMTVPARLYNQTRIEVFELQERLAA